MINPSETPITVHSSVLDEVGGVILHHVSNSEALIPLPSVLGIDFSITKHVIMLWIAALVVFTLFYLGTRIYRREKYPVPSGLSNALESLVNFIRTQVVIPYVGKEDNLRWSPLILTFFFFILTTNSLGMIPLFDLIPGGSTATGNFNVTAGLATVTFMAIIAAGSIKHGFIGHWKNLAPAGHPFGVYFLLVPIEIIAMFVKPFALTMRLAANMTGGHIAILSIMSFIFIFSELFGNSIGIATGAFVSVPLNVAISGLEIIVILIQAYVFTLLSSIFVGMAIHPHH
ncbi:MAG: F0F1 ATP synthase subunit A [Fidelibacterota bacterium]